MVMESKGCLVLLWHPTSSCSASLNFVFLTNIFQIYSMENKSEMVRGILKMFLLFVFKLWVEDYQFIYIYFKIDIKANSYKCDCLVEAILAWTCPFHHYWHYSIIIIPIHPSINPSIHHLLLFRCWVVQITCSCREIVFSPTLQHKKKSICQSMSRFILSLVNKTLRYINSYTCGVSHWPMEHSIFFLLRTMVSET